MTAAMPPRRYNASSAAHEEAPRKKAVKMSIVVIGTGGSGVNSFIDRQIGIASGDQYEREPDPCDDYDYRSTIRFPHDQEVLVQWEKLRPGMFPDDTCLTPSFSAYGKHILQNCEACILIYSSSSADSLKAAAAIWRELTSEPRPTNLDGPPCQHVWVVANKIDRPDRWGEASMEEGERWGKEIGAEFRTMSARTEQNTSELAREVVAAILECKEGEAKAAATAWEERAAYGRDGS